MIRDFIGTIFGFRKEIQELRNRVAELSWDKTFGMWTREAFLEFCRVMPRGTRVVAFIDLDNIHNLNHWHGYAEVDRRVKCTFSIPFRRSDIVARWYSGDEIVILFDSDRAGAERKLNELRESAHRCGLTFVYEVGDWEVGKRMVMDVIGELADRSRQKKLSAWRTGPVTITQKGVSECLTPTP